MRNTDTQATTTVPTDMVDRLSTTLDKLAAEYEAKGYSKDEATAEALAEFRRVWK